MLGFDVWGFIVRITTRRLPHVEEPEATCFLTWRLAKGQAALNQEERELVVEVLRYFSEDRYRLLVWVVMDSHVHCVVRLFPDQTLSSLLHSWKSYSANQLQRRFDRRNVIWQEERYDRIIRTEKELMATAKYILDNPFKKWPELKSYSWRGVHPELGTLED